MSVAKGQVITLLENVLFESPAMAFANAAGWASLSAINAAYSTVSGLAGVMAQTQEAHIPEEVIRLYSAALGRAPSGAEVAFYTGLAEHGLSANQIASGSVPTAEWNQIASFFVASPESFTNPASTDPVSMLFHNVLGRAPSGAETAFYHAQMQHGLGVQNLLQEFANSPEYQNKVDSTILADLAHYGVAVAGGHPTSSIDPLGLIGVQTGNGHAHI